MSFEFKYLKYKNKYLKLKNLLGGAPNDDVYILIDSGPPNRWVPMPARDYQKDALNKYIEGKNVEKINYKYENGSINFFIEPHTTPELYTLIRQDGSTSKISRNKEKLKALGGFYNRMSDPSDLL